MTAKGEHDLLLTEGNGETRQSSGRLTAAADFCVELK
jgi:hypothetical protein